MGKSSEEEIRELEKQNRMPRVTTLEDKVSATVLDERYLLKQTPRIRRNLYKHIPAHIAQIIEVFFIQHRFDIILSQSEKVAFPLSYLMKILRFKIPHVVIISRITSVDEKQSKRKKWFMKHIKDYVSKFLIWSKVQRQIAIEELGVAPDKIVLLKRGTDQKFWYPSESDTDMICSVGMEARDYPTLIEAMRNVDIPCHIAVSSTRGELFDTVKRLYDIDDIPSNISVGRKSHEELRSLYQRCRFVVVTLMESDSDNGLTTILEAMAMGKPVICSKTEGQVGIIEDGVNGIFVPQGDKEALRKAIIELWNDPERCREMGAKGRKFIEENHSMEQFVDEIHDEMRSILEPEAGKSPASLKLEKV
jgi:glycosyltransferase involved in cell wall biosynthesis